MENSNDVQNTTNVGNEVLADVSESLFTQKQFDYVMSVPDIYLRSHLLHQVRLRDNMEADRNKFEVMYNELCEKYNAR